MPSWAACSAFSSVPGSKAAVCTRTAISASGTRGEERHLVAVPQGFVEPAQSLAARAHQAALGQHLPGAAARQHMVGQRAQGGEAVLPVQLLAVAAQPLAVAGEILQANHGASSVVA